MEQEWRPVYGFEGHYSVSNDGKIRSEARARKTKSNGVHLLKSRIRKPRLQPNGYHSITLWLGCVPHPRSIHRLVACAFVPNPNGLPCVNHKNLNKSDNRVSNLEWVTWKENIQHAKAHGKLAMGADHYKAKLTDEIVKHIRALWHGGRSALSLSKDYGVCSSAVDHIVHRRTWKHVR